MNKQWRRYLRFWGTDVAADVDDELQFHLDERIAEYRRHGLSPSDAERLARQRFGDVTEVRQLLEAHDHAETRQFKRRELVGNLMQDMRVAVRGFRRTPGFVAVILATLAIGIGANTAVFAVVTNALIDRLPYRDAQQLQLMYGASNNDRTARGMVSLAEIENVKERSRSVASVAAFGLHGGVTYASEHEAELWSSTSVDGAFFNALGVAPLLGRTISAGDAQTGAAPVVMLSYGLWRRAFGGDSTVVGRAVRLNDIMTTVIGVMPATFIAPIRTPESWVPLDVERILASPSRNGRMLSAVVRLKSSASVAQAHSELDVIEHSTENQNDGARARRALNAVPVRDAMVGKSRTTLLVVMGASALLLLIACVNVAGLFLARATSRQRELALRSALGAGRARLVRQLLAESVLIAVTGGTLGVAVAFGMERIIVAASGSVLPSMGTVPAISGRVVGFSLLLTMLSCAIFGLLPAFVGTRLDIKSTLGESSRGAAGGKAQTHIARVLVGGQIALAVVLLVAAGLLGRTVYALRNSGVGYTIDSSIATFHANLSLARYQSRDSRTQFFTTLLSRVRSLPGVKSAGLVGISPWNGWNSAPLEIKDRPTPITELPSIVLATASDGFFSSLDIPVREGRSLLASDVAGAQPVAVVSEQLARQYWPSGGAVGEQIRFGGRDTVWRTIVGVVGDVRENATSETEAVAYQSVWQSGEGGEIVVRTNGDASSIIPAIRRELHELDANVPVAFPRVMSDIFSATIAAQRLLMMFVSAFATLALVLAALGIYGVIAYAVTLRRREFGIRTALGGTRRSILLLVMRQGLATAALGTLAGLGIAAASSRVLSSVLFGVRALDATTFVVVPIVLAATSILATLLPARRAVKMDAVVALREE